MNIILDWEGLEIKEFELQSIGDHQCVADAIISFQMKVLSKRFPDQSCAFICPSTVQFIQQFPCEITADTIKSLHFENYKYVFLPLSDVDVGVDHASHWSLVVMDMSDSTIRFKHFDSMNQSNVRSGRALASSIVKVLGIEGSEFMPLRSPTQPNGYDCGVYVMKYIESLVECDFDHEAACKLVTAKNVSECRSSIRNHILTLTKQ